MKPPVKFALLIFYVLIRLYNINSPIIGVHSWRQADTAAMARNYYENGFRFLYPQIDWGGSGPGYVESEFPIVPFLVSLLYAIFGISEILGRLLSVICSLLTMIFLYRLTLRLTDPKIAMWTSVIYGILPLNIFYSRAFMPESALLMCLVMGVYYFDRWLETEKKTDFVLSCLFITLACLIKIPSLYIGLPLLYLAWSKYGRSLLRRWPLWLYSLIVILSVALWYYHAHQIKLNYGLTFGIWEYGADKWGNWDQVLTLSFWRRIVFQSLAERHLTWAGFVVFVVGLFLRRKYPRERLFDYWLLALLVYFIIAARGNFVHEYYQLPFVIPAAVFMGKVYSMYLRPRWLFDKRSIALVVILLLIGGLSAGRYYEYMRKERPGKSERYVLAGNIKRLTPEKSLVITVDNDDPALLYLSHRKGWRATAETIDYSYVHHRISEGARFMAGFNGQFRDPDKRKDLSSLLSEGYRLIYSDSLSFIIDLSEENSAGS